MRPQLPDYGVYPWWPAEGFAWIHPDSVARARHWIPSQHVFRRSHFDGIYYHLEYGRVTLRVRPSMWLPVRYEGLDVGQRVEVSGLGLAQEPFVGRVSQMLFDRRVGHIQYRLRRSAMEPPRLYRADQLRSLDPQHTLRPSDFATNRR